MTETSDLSGIPRTASRGVVGDKRLLLVQTFDIARLTTHVVPLVPGTFVAVSGQGPLGDSNGSGKTSFLAAVSILLGDPQWRFDTQGGKWAAGVLFRPSSAGVHSSHDGRAANEGYIAGVFADPDDSGSMATTVWVRLSTNSPYIEARWAVGTHLADEDDDVKRDLQAPAIWQSIKQNGTLSARAMSAHLYGDAPRCLTYLDTPLRPAVPSLLSQQLTEMSPRDIGESLIALSGSKAHMEEERFQRGDVLEREKQRDASLKEHREREAKYEADLSLLRDRDRARADIDDALLAWRVYLAVQYMKALDRDRQLEHDIEQADLDVTAARTRTEEVRTRSRTLSSRSDLQRRCDDAEREWSAAKQQTTAIVREKAALEAQQQARIDERSRLTPRAAGWNGRTVDEAEEDVSHQLDKLTKSHAACTAAEQHVRSVEERLAQAENGITEGSATALALLRDEGIDAAALIDVIDIAEDARTLWEPRLWPWRDAVIVDHQDVRRAREVVATSPGAILIHTDDHPTALPAGVHSSLHMAGYLNALQERTAGTTNPSGTHDAALGLWVSGDFTEAVTGRAAMVMRIHAELETAQERHQERLTDLELARIEVKSAQGQLKAAQAAHRLKELADLEPGTTAALTKKTLDLREAQGDEARKQEAWTKAGQALATHKATLETLRIELNRMEDQERLERAALHKLKQAREALEVEQWRKHWADDEGPARELADHQPELAALDTAVLRSRSVDHVNRAMTALGHDEREGEKLPDDIRTAIALRHRLQTKSADVPPTVDIDSVIAPFKTRLDGWADRDRGMVARIDAERAQHRLVHQGLEDLLDDGRSNLTVVQDMISSRIEAILQRVSIEFDRLDQARGGCGAELHVTHQRPDGAGEWEWHVTPRWRRSHTGGFVSYREVANGAQVKVYAIQLVLAALLSDADTRGRVLVLDELGNSLGEVNRKDVLRSLKRVAEDKQVTILGTCQDSVVDDAADACGQLLWFEHSAVSDVYNQPTRVWGFDPDGRRVELTKRWVVAGRRGW